MNESKIREKEETIKMMIVSAHLSLNSPVYINVDVEKLKEFNLTEQMSQFIQIKPTLLKSFKQVLEETIEKFQERLEVSKKTVEKRKERYEEFAYLHWNIYNKDSDILQLFENFLKNNGSDLLEYKEKSEFFTAVTNIANNPTLENAEALRDIFAGIASRIRAEIKYIENGNLKQEYYITLMKSVAQCFDEEGRIIRLISNDLINQCFRQIDYSHLNKILLQRDIVIEQSHQLQRQRVAQIAKIIEEKRKKLSKKYKTKKENRKPTVINTNELFDDQKELLQIAQKIVKMELNEVQPNEEMELDELETLFVEDLQSDDLTKEKLERIISEDANSDLCRIKFIVYGLSYQLENIKDSNLEKTLELIDIYVYSYKNYREKLIKYSDQQKEYSTFIEQSLRTLKYVIDTYKYIEKKFDNITEEQKQYIKSYEDTKLNDENIDDINKTLVNVNIDSSFITLYNTYKSFDNTIKDVLDQFESMKNERITNKDMSYITERLEIIRELQKQLEEADSLYEEKQKSLAEQQDTKNIMTQNDDNILVFFELEDGTPQAEKRIIEDSKTFGRYRQSEVGELERLLGMLKTKRPEELKPPQSTYIKIGLGNYKGCHAGRRLSTNGVIRVAYEQISSDILNTDKPVYLIISAGKKVSNESNVYIDAIHLKNKVNEFIEHYKTFAHATKEEKEAFINKQRQNEERIMYAAQNGKGAEDYGDSGFKK